jgi:hypothetical protein
MYLKKCKELEIDPVPAALPKADEPLEASSTQQSLDGFVKPMPKWSKEGLLEHLIDFVVSDDQVYLSKTYIILFLMRCGLQAV